MEKHPAAEWPQAGDPQEEAGLTRGWGSLSAPGPRSRRLEMEYSRHRAAAPLGDSVFLLLLPSGLLLSGPPFCLPLGLEGEGRASMSEGGVAKAWGPGPTRGWPGCGARPHSAPWG